MTARTPWGDALDQAVTTNPDRWWTLNDLVNTAGHLIAPGLAWRAGERRQAHNRTTGSGPAQTSDEARIRRGRRHMIADVANARVRRGRWVTTGTGPNRQWKAAR